MPLSQTEMIAYLTRLKMIKRANGFINTEQVEADFLNFSSNVSHGELTVAIPRTYSLQTDDADKLKAALKADHLDYEPPKEIGITGGFNGVPNDRLFFLSLNQLNCDYGSHSRAYLNPLLIKIYGDGSKIIRDFTIHEALYGKVKCLAGELYLKEIGIFPEKFTAGPYTLVTEIDTPSSSVRKFIELGKLMNEFKNNEEESLKSEGRVTELTEKALELRQVMGSLSRYETPKTNIFSTQTDSCIIENGTSNYFYLYTPSQNKNVLVYFGESPLSKTPRDLLVLNGEDKQSALANLLGLDFYKVSPAILSQRVKDISSFYDAATRTKQKSILAEQTDFGKLLERLRMNERIINDMASEEGRKNFALGQPAEMLEFMICPSNSDPVIHDLLSHLSWSNSLKTYHNSLEFIKNFERANSKEREEMLRRVTCGINFTNQQNNDVNVWLYQNHKGFCTSKGLEFKLLE